MSTELKIVHYLNQFFGGIGGEDKAMTSPQIKQGPVGPGEAIQNILKGRGKIVATVLCGDNYFAERVTEATQEIIELLAPHHPDALIAGPAFNAGRYGIACGAVCKAVQEKLRIPAVTGMHEENPGADIYKREVYIVRTANSVAGMADAIIRMVNLLHKLSGGKEIGTPLEEGYLPRGILRQEVSRHTGAERAVAMLLARLRGEAFETELHPPRFERVKPAPALQSISASRIAVVTDGGLVPRGNPDRIERLAATRYGRYTIGTASQLSPDDYEVVHIGYDATLVKQDLHRLLPLDVLKDMEKEGVIGEVGEAFYSTTGVSTTLENSKTIGKAIVNDLQSDGVDGAILTST